ncbi:hypothetical protein [Bradyrhizobium sp. RT9a]|uniref:hypothetical protein n=1 Tax=Bradyrhizobium sp. RT9a TaxID=3156384 RepID=UPI0033952C04
MKHPLLDLFLHFILALLVLGLLAVGIVLMLIFTIVDAAAHVFGKLRRAAP